MLDTINLLPEGVDEADLSVSSQVLLDGLKEMEACPKATWKKLVIDMQV
jgi:hypothetical protein